MHRVWARLPPLLLRWLRLSTTTLPHGPFRRQLRQRLPRMLTHLVPHHWLRQLRLMTNLLRSSPGYASPMFAEASELPLQRVPARGMTVVLQMC
jgi:hypothetical protein